MANLSSLFSKFLYRETLTGAEKSSIRGDLSANSKPLLVLVDGDSLANDKYNTSGDFGENASLSNPLHWISLLRDQVEAMGGTVISIGQSSQPSSFNAARIATTAALADPAEYERAIYILFTGTNDFSGTANSVTIANVQTCCAAMSAEGYETVVVVPHARTGFSYSQTYPAAIRAASGYDRLLDFGATEHAAPGQGWRAHDGVHFSETGSRIMANRVWTEVILGQTPPPVVGTDGCFQTVNDCVAWHALKELPLSEVLVTGRNDGVISDSYPYVGETAVNLTGNLTIHIAAGAQWRTLNSAFKYADFSAITELRITGPGEWNANCNIAGTSMLGSNAPDKTIIDCDRVTGEDWQNNFRPTTSGTLIWGVRKTRIASIPNGVLLYAYGASEKIVIRPGCEIVDTGDGPGIMSVDSSANIIIDSARIIRADGIAIKNSYAGSGTYEWIGASHVSSNTAQTGTTDVTTNGSITVLSNTTITNAGYR